MSNSWNTETEHQGQVRLGEVDARQATTGMGVRYVLAISLGAVIVIFGILYLMLGFHL